MEWILVAFAVALVAILMCDIADEIAYWWMLRRTAPHGSGDDRQASATTPQRG
ncbi:MAG TPA: hypothetical protein VEL07_19780 [Planctomycetota bacterium]|nr:hypothetical protein [Planctomycetota bacterium]